MVRVRRLSSMSRRAAAPTGGLRSGGSFNAGSMRTARVQGAKATLTTALAGTNNDLKFTAQAQGTAGNSITVAFVNPGGTAARSISVASNAITVNLAVTAGAINGTETANSIIGTINGSTAAQTLVTVENAPSNDGTGVVTALAATPLAGGSNPNI